MALAAKKFAGALGAGCSLMCKPSQETPGSVLAMANALLNACRCEGDVHRLDPYRKRLAAFAGEHMKTVTMELGGHVPTIVCGDVEPEKVADLLAKAKLKNAGQICLSPSRFFVEDGVSERFAARMAEHARTWRVGPRHRPADADGAARQ